MTRTIFIATALVLAVALPAVPAQAAESVSRTFVSAAGNDSNNCANVLTPCRHLANAYAVTAPNGEIYVLDPANYGSLTIVGPVSIEGHGWASIAPASGNPAITINANTGDKINIIGVVLDGTNLAGTNGIQFNSGGSLIVRDSVIRNFSVDGINFQPSASSPSQLSVSNTLISDNGTDGILFEPTGSETMTGVLDHVNMENNGEHGINVVTSTQLIDITVSDSVMSNNQVGITSNSGAGTLVSVMVRNSTIANNTINGLVAENTGARIWITRSTITGNASGWNALGGQVLSFADNNIAGNSANETAPPGPLSYK